MIIWINGANAWENPMWPQNWQIQYLENEYLNAVKINTGDKSLNEIVDEIMSLLLNNSSCSGSGQEFC